MYFSVYLNLLAKVSKSMAKRSKKQAERDEKIFQISTMVAGDFELLEVLDRLAEAAVKFTNTTACSIRLVDEAAEDMKMRSTYGLSEKYRNKGPVSRKDAVIEEALKGKAVIIDDMGKDARVKYPQASLDEGLISQMTVPMEFKGDCIGVLRLYSPKPARFDEETTAIAYLVASQCAIAITNARLYSQAVEGARMAEQMRLGAVIQRRMIPDKLPHIHGLDIGAVYQPCFQIGGDLYDFFRINEHTLGVGIADVIGKGIPAAIMMSMFRGTMRAYADGGYARHKLEDIIGKLNTATIRECRDGEFITMFFASIDVDDMKITYCNCGHEPALLIRDGQITELDKGGLVLGVLKDTEYEIGTVDLQEGDCILMYTDGLIDAVNFDGDMWGREQMLDALAKCKNCCAESMIKNLLGFRRRFVGLAPQTDDTSVVVIKMDSQANPHDQNVTVFE
jgi:sigma-B regulation protein RsbU (phosphoserine phosphatase)